MVPLFFPTLPGREGKAKNSREIQDLTSIAAEMTGASCLARAVAPRAAAAVDHAYTELIGHRGWKGTGFLCDEKAASREAAFCFYKECSTEVHAESSGSFLRKELGEALRIGPKLRRNTICSD